MDFPSRTAQTPNVLSLFSPLSPSCGGGSSFNILYVASAPVTSAEGVKKQNSPPPFYFRECLTSAAHIVC